MKNLVINELNQATEFRPYPIFYEPITIAYIDLDNFKTITIPAQGLMTQDV